MLRLVKQGRSILFFHTIPTPSHYISYIEYLTSPSDRDCQVDGSLIRIHCRACHPGVRYRTYSVHSFFGISLLTHPTTRKPSFELEMCDITPHCFIFCNIELCKIFWYVATIRYAILCLTLSRSTHLIVPLCTIFHCSSYTTIPNCLVLYLPVVCSAPACPVPSRPLPPFQCRIVLYWKYYLSYSYSNLSLLFVLYLTYI